jgi:hypothetical protein
MELPTGQILPAVASTAVYVDGVYEGIGGDYDIARVEVLRGPPGTLQSACFCCRHLASIAAAASALRVIVTRDGRTHGLGAAQRNSTSPREARRPYTGRRLVLVSTIVARRTLISHLPHARGLRGSVKLSVNRWLVCAAAVAGVAFGTLPGAHSAGVKAASQTSSGPEKTYYFLVFSNPVAGKEAEYNDWYEHIHAPVVIDGPGFVSAQRFIMSDVPLTPGPPDAQKQAKYMVLFIVKTRDINAVRADFMRRMKLAANIDSPAFDHSSLFSYTVTPVGPVISAAEVRAQRAARDHDTNAEH